MDYLAQLFVGMTGNANQSLWLFAAAVGAGVGLFGLGLLTLASGMFDPLRKRLSSISDAGQGSKASSRTFAKVLEPFEAYVLPRKDSERSKVQQRLIHAGYRSESAITYYYGAKLVLAIAFVGIVLVVATLLPKFTLLQVAYGVLIASFIGLILPSIYLTHAYEKRQKVISNGFPDALDLLVTCTEAGLGLNAALERVGNEITVSCPPLSEELSLINAEIRAGVDRIRALKNLAERTGLPDIQGLVSLLCQSMRFGTSVADTLRIYSEEFRDKRLQRAEELAAKIGTKMIFPLVLCLFPSFFLVAIGPAILGVIRALQGAGLH